MRFSTCLLSLMFAALLAPPQHARGAENTSAKKSDDSLFSSKPASTWIVTVGATARLSPDYEGAISLRGGAFPSLSWRREGDDVEFSSPDDGIDLTLYADKTFRFGPVLNIQGGRYLKADRRLAGLRKVPWSAEAGAFAEYWPIQDRLRTRIEIRYGLHGHTGLVGDLSADYVARFGRLTLSGGPRLTVAGSRFMNANFGVTPAEALLNGHVAAFKAKAGVKAVGVGVAATYALSQNWTGTVFHRFDYLTGDAAASPITKAVGQRTQFTFGVSAAYSFRLDR